MKQELSKINNYLMSEYRKYMSNDLIRLPPIMIKSHVNNIHYHYEKRELPQKYKLLMKNDIYIYFLNEITGEIVVESLLIKVVYHEDRFKVIYNMNPQTMVKYSRPITEYSFNELFCQRIIGLSNFISNEQFQANSPNPYFFNTRIRNLDTNLDKLLQIANVDKSKSIKWVLKDGEIYGVGTQSLYGYIILDKNTNVSRSGLIKTESNFYQPNKQLLQHLGVKGNANLLKYVMAVYSQSIKLG